MGEGESNWNIFKVKIKLSLSYCKYTAQVPKNSTMWNTEKYLYFNYFLNYYVCYKKILKEQRGMWKVYLLHWHHLIFDTRLFGRAYTGHPLILVTLSICRGTIHINRGILQARVDNHGDICNIMFITIERIRSLS